MNNIPIKIFYAHSTHNTSYDFYEKICTKFNNKKTIQIIDVDDINDETNLLNKILKEIDKADLFICDITPDYKENDVPYINPNVLLELGYAKKSSIQIMYIIDSQYKKDIPSMLKGIYYNEYENNEYGLETIGEIINNIVNNIKKYYKGWTTHKYKLTCSFINNIQNIIDVIISNYVIRINKKNRKIVILFECNGGYTRVLNIELKELELYNKIIELSLIKEINDELKHIELLANISWFK
jgi:hypothetical protein